MEDKKNPNGVNNETEVVRKAAPPPMKKAKKGETSQAVLDAAKKAVVEKNTEKAKKEDAKKQEKKETEKEVAVPVVAEKAEVEVNEVKTETPLIAETKKDEKLVSGFSSFFRYICETKIQGGFVMKKVLWLC